MIGEEREHRDELVDFVCVWSGRATHEELYSETAAPIQGHEWDSPASSAQMDFFSGGFLGQFCIPHPILLWLHFVADKFVTLRIEHSL